MQNIRLIYPWQGGLHNHDIHTCIHVPFVQYNSLIFPNIDRYSSTSCAVGCEYNHFNCRIIILIVALA